MQDVIVKLDGQYLEQRRRDFSAIPAPCYTPRTNNHVQMNPASRTGLGS